MKSFQDLIKSRAKSKPEITEPPKKSKTVPTLDLSEYEQDIDKTAAGPDYPWLQQVTNLNTQVFKNPDFRPHQLEIINKVISGKDVFVCMPTGGGKSLLYQLPAVLSKGFTVVVEPLISLMNDQIDHLTSLGIYAATLPNPNAKILFVTPEKLGNNESALNWLIDRKESLARIVIDEAHCVSQWGRGFRPDYRKLSQLREILPEVPILAMTATATERVRRDIIQVLGMRNPEVLISSFNRPNLHYEVRIRNTNAYEQVASYIKTKHVSDCGIIYCLAQKECENLAKTLKRNHRIKALAYHAGMETREREKAHEEWINGLVTVIVATVAFGMGIDKKDVRFVLHFNLPSSLENYYQESGRAGRDGLPADCLIFYKSSDKSARLALDSNDLQRISEMVGYCEEKFDCRRKIQLNYFGEEFDPVNCSRHCDNCNAQREFYVKNMNSESLVILNAIRHHKCNTAKQIVELVRGEHTKFRSSNEFGTLSMLSQEEVIQLIKELVSRDVLRESYASLSHINYVSIGLGDNSQYVESMNIEVKVENNTSKSLSRPRNESTSKKIIK